MFSVQNREKGKRCLICRPIVIRRFGPVSYTHLDVYKRQELSSQPARLLRPRTMKKGKRIFLERITPLWKRLSFLQKITLRNMFRYKQRLVMMLVGISCSAGLVVTGFGVRDSMIDTGSMQFDTVQKYDIEVSRCV